MFNKITLYLKNFDWLLFSAVLLLVCYGLIEIYSVSLGRGGLDLINFKKQILFVGVGFCLLFFLSFLNYRGFREVSNYFYIFGVFLLISVLIFGETIRGTRGWFNFGSFSIQPVEFIKLFLILFLAHYLSRKQIKIEALKHFILTGLSTLLLAALILLQPDFGSALILCFIWLFITMLSGFKKKYFILIFLVSILLFIFSWALYFKPYQKERIMVFLNPSSQSLAQGYNITQATIAIGSGGFFGRGVGFGSQSQLKFLPESQNDFIFAVVSEEFGFFGVVLIILFFAVFFYRCLVNIGKINDDFGVFFILGAMGLIFIEMFTNIGMNIGMLPVVGISLPFLSYGGSAMITNLALVGIIESIIIRNKINY